MTPQSQPRVLEGVFIVTSQLDLVSLMPIEIMSMISPLGELMVGWFGRTLLESTRLPL